MITRHLSEKLGEDGFGCVYKGKLFDGTLGAVRYLETPSSMVITPCTCIRVNA